MTWRAAPCFRFDLSNAERAMIALEEAVAIARARAATQGWRFGDPTRCTLRRGWFGGRDRYEIGTNAGRRGTKARFTIDAETGLIIDEGYIPR